MTEDNVMKIADFGLARDIHHIDYYKKTTNVSGAEGVWGGRVKLCFRASRLLLRPWPTFISWLKTF